MTILDIITIEQLSSLREAGFVVIHREPTELMIKSALRHEYCYGAIKDYFHRMVGTSIREQNIEISKERGNDYEFKNRH